MAATERRTIAFARPGGERSETSDNRPIDLGHLSRQTLGDRRLEEEVLQLFVQQLLQTRARIGAAKGRDRRLIAHGLKGAARNVGAFALAERAAAVEADPGNDLLLPELYEGIETAIAFACSITR